MVSQVGKNEFPTSGKPAVACNGNLWFPIVGNHDFLTCGNRQFLAMVTCGSHVGNSEFQPLGTGSFLAMNQTQTFRYRSIKQNKAFFTGPLSKTIKL